MFQSTHPHGVRPFADCCFHSSSCFNPRTHMGCDIQCKTARRRKTVSIHAPTWGATKRSSIVGFHNIKFQSTHPHGVRPKTAVKNKLMKEFQSTHPHGVRPTLTRGRDFSMRFQSTHPHGVRHRQLVNYQLRAMFQSTHPHGVRPKSSHN